MKTRHVFFETILEKTCFSVENNPEKIIWGPERFMVTWKRAKTSTDHQCLVPCRFSGVYVFYFLSFPRCSMYGIFTYIYHKFKPNESKYPIHWASGFVNPLFTRCFLSKHLDQLTCCVVSDLEDNDSQTISCVSLRILVSPKEGISPIILFWGWDWNPQSYSREVSGVLGSVFQGDFWIRLPPWDSPFLSNHRTSRSKILNSKEPTMTPVYNWGPFCLKSFQHVEQETRFPEVTGGEMNGLFHPNRKDPHVFQVGHS